MIHEPYRMEAELLGCRHPFLDRPERHAQLGEIEGVLHGGTLTSDDDRARGGRTPQTLMVDGGGALFALVAPERPSLAHPYYHVRVPLGLLEVSRRLAVHH